MAYETLYAPMVAKAQADGWTEVDIAITWKEASDVVQQKHPALLQRNRDSFFWAQDLAVWTAYWPNEPFPVPEPALVRRRERERQETNQSQISSRSTPGQQTNRNTASTAVQPVATVASTAPAPAARGYAQQQIRNPATHGARGHAQRSTLQPTVPAFVPGSQATSSKVAAVAISGPRAVHVNTQTQQSKRTASEIEHSANKRRRSHVPEKR